ncbi:nuclear transport factor 2 family protein [Sphingobium nicotianae]|uniref:Nuclear transport factor 2 family protein n=1 Tax=Sphingobium nicotianae TaxID=2782607 RepID=A0A9X1IQC4_9SPHN|nr:nuclear transport factor 2 family protein [Sphingobium nicotianae]MBT2186435.1 nuclear transport factor 2 family protein [Sphingobium nicotianae]
MTSLAAAAALLAGAVPASAQRNEAADRAAIHALLMAYGATLDARDFDGFSKLFGADGVYVAGGGREAKGAATGEMMRGVFANNPSGVGEPNFHLFYNEVVTFDGPDKAHATSMSLWVVPDKETKRPTPLLSARYEDALVRKGGKWLFARRTVKPITNGPAAAK